MNYCLWINTHPPSLPKLSTHHLCSTFISGNVCITLPAMGEDFSSQLTDVTQNKVDLLIQFEIQFSVYPYNCCSPTDWPIMPEPHLKLLCEHWGANSLRPDTCPSGQGCTTRQPTANNPRAPDAHLNADQHHPLIPGVPEPWHLFSPCFCSCRPPQVPRANQPLRGHSFP